MTPSDAAREPGRDVLAYRPNVGAVLFNRHGLVFVARRADLPSGEAEASGWQFPQGGIDGEENPRHAVLRELREEIGADRAEIIGEHHEWLTYDFPPDLRTSGRKSTFRGQRQRWFALRFTGQDSDIRLDAEPVPEFNAWRWVPLDSVPAMVVAWKRPVYEKVAETFASYCSVKG